MEKTSISFNDLHVRINCICDKILYSIGYRIDREIGKLSQSFYIFNRNHYELKRELESFQSVEKANYLMANENKQKLDDFRDEVLRLFYNFLAAAKSLVEQARYIVEESECKREFKEKYLLEVKQRFFNSECNKFIEDFRNYLVHKGLPNISFTESYDKEKGYSNFVAINIEYLKRWNGWTKLSKQYISSLQPSEDFLAIVTSYSVEIFDFYEWFKLEFLNSHKHEYNQLTDLQNELKELKKQELEFSNLNKRNV